MTAASLTHLAFVMAECTEFANLAHLFPASPPPSHPQAVCSIHAAAREASVLNTKKELCSSLGTVCHLLDKPGQKFHMALKGTNEYTSSSPVLCGYYHWNGLEQEKEIWGRVADTFVSLRSRSSAE